MLIYNIFDYGYNFLKNFKKTFLYEVAPLNNVTDSYVNEVIKLINVTGS